MSFTGIFGDPACLCDLPASNKPNDGFGLLMNLSAKSRWQYFATWMVKLLSKCLTYGTVFVEGLLSLSFVSSACCLLCYGDGDLQMVSCHFVILLYYAGSFSDVYSFSSGPDICHRGL